MVVLVRLFRIDAPSPAHTQMENHRAVAVGMDQPVFSPPSQTAYRCSGQHLRQINREWPTHVGPVDPDTGYAFPVKEPGEPSDRCLNFW